MLTVLQIQPPPQRPWKKRIRHRLRRQGEVTSRLVTVPNGHYLLINAAENRRGAIDWYEVARYAGSEAAHLLLPSGVTPPPDSGIIPFAGQALQQALLHRTAEALLSLLPGLSRRLIVIDDPNGRHTALAASLIPSTADLRILTAHPGAYAATVTAAMEDHGACLPVTGHYGITADAALVLAPDGPTTSTAVPRGWVLSGRAIPYPHTVTGYVPAKSEAFLPYCPATIDRWLFLAGLYERSGIDSLGASPPLTLCAGNQSLSIKDLTWRLAGLDIGLTV